MHDIQEGAAVADAKPSSGRWAKRAAAAAVSVVEVSSSNISTCADTDDKLDHEEASIALALQLEEQQTSGWGSASSQDALGLLPSDGDAASIALAMQLEEDAKQSALSPELLASQFQQY